MRLSACIVLCEIRSILKCYYIIIAMVEDKLCPHHVGYNLSPFLSLSDSLPSSSVPNREPVSMTTWYRRGLPAGGRVYQSSVGISASKPPHRITPWVEWKKRTRKNMYVALFCFGFAACAQNLRNVSG